MTRKQNLQNLSLPCSFCVTGEAEAARLLGEALQDNPGYLKLRKIRAAQNIARTVAQSQNRVYLQANNLLLNLTGEP